MRENRDMDLENKISALLIDLKEDIRVASLLLIPNLYGIDVRSLIQAIIKQEYSFSNIASNCVALCEQYLSPFLNSSESYTVGFPHQAYQQFFGVDGTSQLPSLKEQLVLDLLEEYQYYRSRDLKERSQSYSYFADLRFYHKLDKEAIAQYCQNEEAKPPYLNVCRSCTDYADEAGVNRCKYKTQRETLSQQLCRRSKSMQHRLSRSTTESGAVVFPLLECLSDEDTLLTEAYTDLFFECVDVGFSKNPYYKIFINHRSVDFRQLLDYISELTPLSGNDIQQVQQRYLIEENFHPCFINAFLALKQEIKVEYQQFLTDSNQHPQFNITASKYLRFFRDRNYSDASMVRLDKDAAAVLNERKHHKILLKQYANILNKYQVEIEAVLSNIVQIQNPHLQQYLLQYLVCCLFELVDLTPASITKWRTYAQYTIRLWSECTYPLIHDLFIAMADLNAEQFTDPEEIITFNAADGERLQQLDPFFGSINASRFSVDPFRLSCIGRKEECTIIREVFSHHAMRCQALLFPDTTAGNLLIDKKKAILQERGIVSPFLQP